MSQINKLWEGCHALEPSTLLGGILARKRGYHNSRDHLSSSDYSVCQFVDDRQGPANEGSAIDWTFPDAQRGDYRKIALYSKRLMAAGVGVDPRTKYMREFFGNTDSDKEVEGYDFSRDRYSTSDSSHLWHIHISIHRRYINDPEMPKAILSILKGESFLDYIKANVTDGLIHVNVSPGRSKPLVMPTVQKPTFPPYPGKEMKQEKKPLYNPELARWQARMKQRGWAIDADGYFGPKTLAVVREFQEEKKLGVSGIIGPKTWEAAWTAPITK